MRFLPLPAPAWPCVAPFRLGMLAAVLMTMLHGGSAHALPPGELVADATRRMQRSELRRMLTVDPEQARREASSRRLNEEERARLRRDVHEAARGGYAQGQEGRNGKGKGRRSR